MAIAIVELHHCILQPFGEPMRSAGGYQASEVGNGNSEKPLKGKLYCRCYQRARESDQRNRD